ncbi:MAG TPA: MFS transporter [Stellaceae bacterium]|jgi:MHS family proline/betaine transporter-like MFS transporter|nr:MFS transporter [Stellaceae bacterium]
MPADVALHGRATREQPPIHRVILAASVGNALEWFDFLIYGYFAVTISKVFFPTGNETVSLLVTLGTFGLAYLVRPLGAIVLGAYADRAGRKAALMMSILLMMIGTTVMALIPSYEAIGVAAPIIVMLARLLQGFSVGGEFGSSTAFLVEHSEKRKGFMASWQWASQGVTALVASSFGVALSTMLAPDQLLSWGWRIPFFFGLLIGPVGFYIRSHMAETPEFVAAEPSQTPLRSLLAEHPGAVLIAIGASIISNSSNYLILYIPTYAVSQLHLPQSTGYIATLVGAVILGSVALVAGHWSDKIGRTRIMLAMTVLFFLTSYPIFAAMVAWPSLATAILAAGWLSLVKAGYSGVLPSLLSELFPVEARAIGMSFGYSVSVTIFGGFAPFIATWLIAQTGDKLSPSYYLMATALLSMVAIAAAARRLPPRAA